MKTLYLDCGMGAAGDMLTAALLDLMPDADQLIAKINDLSIPGVEVKKESAVKCGIRGTYISVMVQGVEESEEMYGHDQDHNYVHGRHHSYEPGQEVEHHHDHYDHVQEENHHHEHCAHDTHHHHSSMHEIEHIISELKLSSKVQRDILAVYHLIAEAESYVHISR